MTSPAGQNGYQRRRRETRRLLMEAGRALFVEWPVEQVSIERITDRAGVAKGSFYNHFDSRESLFEQIIEVALQDLLQKYEAFDPPIEDLLARGLARARFAFHTLLSDPDTCRLLLKSGQPSRGGAIDRVLRMVLGEQLAEAVALGSLSHLDTELVYAAYFGVVTQTIGHLLTSEEHLDVDSAADQVTELCFAVLGLPHRPLSCGDYRGVS
ncbi:MAG: TetR/AcrR family transcriptional regulator [Halioglobus sp.]|nr:TetR/AcrR family transcriptional regulator [Halioglobus sp.]